MLRDKDNPSSVRNSVIAAARQNARMVRTALTHEVWEAVNECYMEMKDAKLARKVSERDLPQVLGKIRQHRAGARRRLHGTMLRNEVYDFAASAPSSNAPTTPRASST
jgi:uncharacterized alpha-E superfamily protein